MLLDFNDFIDSEIASSSFDVCIAGAGVAGITLAIALAGDGKRVLLLEGGDTDYAEQSQNLYVGSNIGRDYFELDVARLRYLGGTSNHWSGFCRPLDDFDFEARDDVSGSGWPISRQDLSPWLSSAAKMLDIDETFQEDRPLDGADGNIRRITIQLSPPVRFREKYRKTLEDSEHIWTVVNANAVDIRLTDNLTAVDSLAVAGYAEPSRRLSIDAANFVLALGGMENPRLLLNARSQRPKGVGNDKDLVGRYFMEHFELDVGHVLLSRPMSELFSNLWEDERVGRAVSLAVTRQFIRERGTMNCELRLSETSEWQEPSLTDDLKARLKRMICASDVLVDLARQVDSTFKQTKCLLAHQDAKVDAAAFDAVVAVTCEQAPNPESRVTLAEERDVFGLHRLALDWKLLPIDKATLRESVVELGRSFAASDMGRIRVVDWLLDDQKGVAGLAEGERTAGFHHMGTTRMAHNPGEGVVDRNGKVFGIDNLYLAGSSVFTTGGHVPPTLTIVQLALRLAKHLSVKLT